MLYGEEHPEGELIGSVMERDLRGTGRRGEREGRADLLLVAGTSLSIPGVKRIVKEMAKSLATRSGASVRDGREPPLRAVYVNSEPPAKPAEWDSVFDVWAQGDVQALAALVADESFAPPLPKAPRRTPKKGMPTPSSDTPTKRKRKAEDDDTPTKKRGLALPLTPASTPPRARKLSSSDLPSPSPQPRFTSSPSLSPPPQVAQTEPKAETHLTSTPSKAGKARARARYSPLPKPYPPSPPSTGKAKAKAAATYAPPPSQPSPSKRINPSGVSRFSPPPPLDDMFRPGGGGAGE